MGGAGEVVGYLEPRRVEGQDRACSGVESEIGGSGEVAETTVEDASGAVAGSCGPDDGRTLGVEHEHRDVRGCRYELRALRLDVREEIGTLAGVTDVDVDLVAGGEPPVTVTSSEPLTEQAVPAVVAEAGYDLVGVRR